MRGRSKKIKSLKTLMNLTGVFGAPLNPSLTYEVPRTQLSINKEIFNDIRKMKTTAAQHRLSYLTANQVQSFYRVCLIHKSIGPNHSVNLNTSATFDQPEDYLTFINPQVVEGKGFQEVDQTCLTYPFIRFKVNRYNEITLKFRDETKQSREQPYTGYTAHLLQHCISHLDGKILMNWQLSHGKFFIQKDSASYFPKTSFLLKQYSFRLKDFHTKSDPTLEQKQQFKKMEEDYMARLEYEYSKESQTFSQKIGDKKINIL